MMGEFLPVSSALVIKKEVAMLVRVTAEDHLSARMMQGTGYYEAWLAGETSVLCLISMESTWMYREFCRLLRASCMVCHDDGATLTHKVFLMHSIVRIS